MDSNEIVLVIFLMIGILIVFGIAIRAAYNSNN
uniref:Uncharacterized protein n=1 Tax=viral metagenome TaxID=1070528 RepID=A0A6C0KR80_9ZZZZ